MDRSCYKQVIQQYVQSPYFIPFLCRQSKRVLVTLDRSISCITEGKKEMSIPGIRHCLLEMAGGCDTDAGREAVARAICSISCISEGKREFARSDVCTALLQMGARAETDNTREAVCRAVRNIAIVPEMKAEFATDAASAIFVDLALCSGRWV